MERIITEIMKQFELNEGKIYSINDFYYLGTKNTIKATLLRLEKKIKFIKFLMVYM